MRCPVKTVTATIITTVLLTQMSSAQPIPGLSPKEKARLEEKQARDKQTDKAYKSTLERIPDANKNTDPWGNLRAPSEWCAADSEPIHRRNHPNVVFRRGGGDCFRRHFIGSRNGGGVPPKTNVVE